MKRINLLGSYPNPKNKRYVSENLRTINHRIVASYRGKEFYDGKTRKKRIREDTKMKLQRYRFPRPFALTKLRHRDISMQSVEDDDGEFRLYQGVWRMQPLPGCAPDGENAMRLTYAVEISPRPYLPVALVESRIANDLCNNLKSIRSYVTKT